MCLEDAADGIGYENRSVVLEFTAQEHRNKQTNADN